MLHSAPSSVSHSSRQFWTAPTFFSSFSEAEGETPRMSYSLVSTTLAMMLTGYTARASAEVQLTERADAEAGFFRLLLSRVTRSYNTQTPTHKHMPKIIHSIYNSVVGTR